jgi:hypothetical protein
MRALDCALSIAAVIVAGASVYGLRIADADLWGHLTYGRWFANHGFPETDPFSYATHGQTWYAHEYLSQMILWWSYASGGALGLIGLKCAAGSVALYWLYRSLRLSTSDARIWAPVLMLAACLLGGYLFFRPQLFTYAFFAGFVFVLLRYLLGHHSPLWVLPLCVAAWANLHGGFLAGITIVGVALALGALRDSLELGSGSGLRRTRDLGVALALCLVASVATPLGSAIWPFLHVELANPFNHRFIAEWQPVRVIPLNWVGVLTLFLLFLVSVAACAAQFRHSRPAGLPPWAWLASVLPLAALAFRSNRHVPLLTMWAAPVLGLLAPAALSPSRGRDLPLLVVTLVIGVAGAFEVAAAFHDPWPRIHVETRGPAAQPFGAASFLRVNELGGRLYNPLWWGSYLTWELYPRVVVSSDGRNDTVHAVARIGENFLFYATRDPDLEAPVRDSADFLLAPARAFVTSRVRADSRWVTLYEDSESILFVRNDEAHRGLIARARQSLLSAAVNPPTPFFESD